MATIYVDNVPYEVEDGQNLLHACLSLGFNVPYFCWHPAMHSVGACRQCAVKQYRDESDRRGRIIMSCMTPALDGTRISIDDPEVKAFRASVIAWLMVNHPHDCPVCDEGGECHLQDMTVMTGHNYREYRFRKRTYRNQYLGPFVKHEMNRCIQCYRCVRFYRDYAGGRDLHAFAAHDHVYFGRHEEGVLENEFSGNLVEVCPTGVFTDKTLWRHYARKWDLQTAPSVCVHCGLGCNTIPGERYGTLRRILNRYHHEINGYFLCDRGRFGYEFVNDDRRIRLPLHRAGEAAAVKGSIDGAEALTRLGALLSGGARAIGIGSPRASLEANFALRTLVGQGRFYLGLSAGDCRLLATTLDVLRGSPGGSPSLREVESADAVLVLGEDVTNTAPRLALALRQSVRQQPMKISDRLRIPRWEDAAVRRIIQQEKGPLFVATPADTKLDEVATQTYRAAPDDLARLGYAVARELGAEGQPMEDLPDIVRAMAGSIARALQEADRPLVVSGPGSGEAVLQAAAGVAWALRQSGRPAGLFVAVPECNSLGLALMGGGTLDDALATVQNGEVDTVVVLENDLYRRADATAVDALLSAAKHVVALDHFANATTEKAEFVLPVATFAEADGTLVNNEGRAQRFFQVFVPDGEVRESWRWLRDVGVAAGRAEMASWQSLDDVIAALAGAMPIFAPVVEAAPGTTFRVAGMKIPRQPQRYSGRTAMRAHIAVAEPKPPDDPDSALSFSMEGYDGQPPAALLPRFWAPGWNSVQAVTKFQSEIGDLLRGGDPSRRLVEAEPDAAAPAFPPPPAGFTPRAGEWLIVPVHHIFGSEELSALAPGVAERTPPPFLGLNPTDAQQLRLAAGAEIELVLGGRPRRLAVKLLAGLPAGVAGLPVGMPGLEGIALPTWSRLARSNQV